METLKLRSAGLGANNSAMVGPERAAYNNYLNSTNSIGNLLANPNYTGESASVRRQRDAATRQMNVATTTGAVVAGASVFATLITSVVALKNAFPSKTTKTAGQTDTENSICALETSVKTAKKSGDWSPVQKEVATKTAEYNNNETKIAAAKAEVATAKEGVTTAEASAKGALEKEGTAKGTWNDAQKAHDNAVQGKDESDAAFATRKEGLQKAADTAKQNYNAAVDERKVEDKKFEDAKKLLATKQTEQGKLEESNATLKAEIDNANAKLAERGAEVPNPKDTEKTETKTETTTKEETPTVGSTFDTNSQALNFNKFETAAKVNNASLTPPGQLGAKKKDESIFSF